MLRLYINFYASMTVGTFYSTTYFLYFLNTLQSRSTPQKEDLARHYPQKMSSAVCMHIRPLSIFFLS